MTVERTRQIFGIKMENWTDQQVLQFIGNVSVIGDELLKVALTASRNYEHTGKEQE